MPFQVLKLQGGGLHSLLPCFFIFLRKNVDKIIFGKFSYCFSVREFCSCEIQDNLLILYKIILMLV